MIRNYKDYFSSIFEKLAFISVRDKTNHTRPGIIEFIKKPNIVITKTDKAVTEG
jgi:hypothetical protein